MTLTQKAIKWFNGRGITAFEEEMGIVTIVVDDYYVTISDNEVDYRASLYDDEIDYKATLYDEENNNANQ